METNILEYYNDRITDIIIKKNDEMLYKLFTESLKLKGFCFKDRYEMIEFIKLNCSCEISQICDIYYVNGIEFLLIKHEQEIRIPEINNNNNYKYGFDMTIKYKFL